MKFKVLHLLFFIFSFFAFAKTSYTAVPTQAKVLRFEIAQDSILMYDNDYLRQEDNAISEINRLLQRARRLSNLAFATISIFILIVLLDGIGLFDFAIIVASGSVLLGFILSVLALGKLLKVRKLFDQFPRLEQDEEMQEKWTKSLARSIVANGLFSGLLVLLLVAFSTDAFSNPINPITLLAGIALTLLGIFERIFFNTKKKVNK
jgi:hypothetical protein